jgi:hypothetical protein
LGPGEVKSLVNYFSVPKGEDDIRVVFDGSKFGLNTALWAPPFALPTVDSLLPTLDIGTWHGDIDVREMFYNYLLDPEIQPFCSLHANPYFQETSNQQPLAWVHWQHCVMGLKSSPHGCIKMQPLAEEVFRGDPTGQMQPFCTLARLYPISRGLPNTTHQRHGYTSMTAAQRW